MSFFGKLFGSNPEPSKPESSGATPAANPAEDKNRIKVFDSYGRELFITREEWRKNVLPGTLRSNWNNPDQLYGIIVRLLERWIPGRMS